ncbi:hypothetical protein [Glycomyces arizonensis]|uniref:hypothetical protein n=1 Tax=Glycomyces arizonensis TaxID=256035 RepID=UPI0004124037|nr:hypothetical protein [Glycomyces arizonensis]
MSPDTAAQRHDSTVAQRPEGSEAGTAGQDRDGGGPARIDAEPAPPAQAGKRRPGDPARHGRMWTYLTFAAAAAFTGAVAVVGTNLFAGAAGVAEVSDTPEHSVEEFLRALLDEHDAEAARGWLCEDKADRDLSEATADLAAINEKTGVDWSNVTETGRSVGEATVAADLSTGGRDITWTFTLVAEDSHPQWQVCDMAVR